jgi:hypothetical protein
MIGQILVYRYNDKNNAKPGMKRNCYTLIDVNDRTQFRDMIINALDSVHAGKGYVLAKWNGNMFICEKNLNNPEENYVKHSVGYHPLQNVFSC